MHIYHTKKTTADCTYFKGYSNSRTRESKTIFDRGYSCKGKLFTAATRNTYRVELQWFLRYELEQELPLTLQQILTKEPLTYPEQLVPYEQFMTFIETFTSSPQQIAFLLLFHSGLRPHENLSLTAINLV